MKTFENKQPAAKGESLSLEAIRTRAYQLFEQPGREHGGDLDDWLKAESEITQQTIRKAAA